MFSKEKNNSSEPGPFPPLTLHTGHYILELLIFGLAVHLILPQITALENSLSVISSMNRWIFIFACMAQMISYLEYGYLLKACVSIARQQLSVLWATMITIAASSIGLIAGGTLGNSAATYRWTNALGVNREGAVLAGTLPPAFNNTTLLIVASLGIVHLLVLHELSGAQMIAFFLISAFIGFIIVIGIWGNFHRSKLISSVCRISAFWAKLQRSPHVSTSAEAMVQRLFESLDRLKGDGWKQPIISSFLSIGFDIMTLYLIFMAAGYKVTFGILFAGYGLPMLFGKMAFLIPGGVGIVEGSMAALYNTMGVPAPITVIVILTYRIVSFWVPNILGFPLVFYLQQLTLQTKKNGDLKVI